MAGVDAKDYNLYVNVGSPTPTKTKLEASRSFTLNTGRGTERVTGKDQTVSYITDSGFSITGAFLEQRPLGPVQAALWDAHDNRTPVTAFFESAIAGGQRWTGSFLVAIDSIDSPEEGVQEHSFTLSIDGNEIRETVS